MIISVCVDHISYAVLQICELLFVHQIEPAGPLLYNTPHTLADGQLTQFQNLIEGEQYLDLPD